ncbi:MAG TPA: hypothetical protein EYG03_04890 [Planctomycetes bacterium]|nr:hypothetical protein [Fuerstiella sp.]HIK91311.1 hypothetical protein [Planctomycetota bacterium]
MINGAAKFLTLLSLLFHAGMGCCAHHDHCSAFPTAQPSADKLVEAHQNSTCSCAYHHGEERLPDENSSKSGDDSCPCGHNHSDCTDHCSWLTASKVEVPSDHDIVLPETIANCDLSGMAATLTAISLIGDSLLMSPSGDSLRASTQVWRL